MTTAAEGSVYSFTNLEERIRAQLVTITRLSAASHYPPSKNLLLDYPKLDSGNYTFNNPIGLFSFVEIQEIFTALSNHLLNLSIEDYTDDFGELTRWLDMHLLCWTGLGTLETYASRKTTIPERALQFSLPYMILVVVNFLVALGYEFIAIRGTTIVVACYPEMNLIV